MHRPRDDRGVLGDPDGLRSVTDSSARLLRPIEQARGNGSSKVGPLVAHTMASR